MLEDRLSFGDRELMKKLIFKVCLVDRVSSSRGTGFEIFEFSQWINIMDK